MVTSGIISRLIPAGQFTPPSFLGGNHAKTNRYIADLAACGLRY
jgi:hypothetical protein